MIRNFHKISDIQQKAFHVGASMSENIFIFCCKITAIQTPDQIQVTGYLCYLIFYISPKCKQNISCQCLNLWVKTFFIFYCRITAIQTPDQIQGYWLSVLFYILYPTEV